MKHICIRRFLFECCQSFVNSLLFIFWVVRDKIDTIFQICMCFDCINLLVAFSGDVGFFSFSAYKFSQCKQYKIKNVQSFIITIFYADIEIYIYI